MRSALPRLILVAASIGIAGGALFGGIVATCVFLLADLTRVAGDLVWLTVYTTLPGALLGGVAGTTIAVAAAAVSRLRGRPVALVTFTRRLATLAFGSTFLVLAAVGYVIARRPTVIVSLATLLPIAAGALFLVVAVVRAGRDVVPGSDRPAVRPRTAAAITLASLVVPPIVGLLRPTLLGDARPGPATARIERDAAVRRRRVLVLGWDGATWDVADPMLRAGKLPALARLLERGTRGEILAEPQVIQPFANSASAGARTPALWETIATGKQPMHHGIWDFECTIFSGVGQAVPFRIASPFGRTVPTTGDMSRAERVWYMLDRAGVSTAVVGWPNTWPARRPLQNGVVVSTLAERDVTDKMQPPDAVDATALCADTKAEAIRAERTIFSLPGDDSSPPPWEVAATPLEADILRTFYYDYQGGLCDVRIALDLNARRHPEFVAVYLSLTDVTQHKFWRYRQPELFPDVPAEQVARYGVAIEAAYRFADEQLGRLVQAMGDDTTVIVLADHGGGPWVFDGLQGLVQSAFRQFHPAYSGNHRMNALLAMGGPGVARGAAIRRPRHVDVTPTVLHLFGLPMARDLPGRVLAEALDGGSDGTAARAIATYQVEPSEGGLRPTASPADADVEQRLRALGYVQ